ncbi:MAG: winged helix-turn-helix transcriptional regulator [Candidatus Thalassarchaeaceae archaeon]|jgi:DNA-binding HxlR family transcriptional regulator
MPREPMKITNSDYEVIDEAIKEVKKSGTKIRKTFAPYNENGEYDIEWEVGAAVEAFSSFSSRWSIEILAALYIAGDRRFNEMRNLLKGISSRTLSDKLTHCADLGLVNRIVDEGPPIRVRYQLTEHGRNAGRLLSPLVAYMKIQQGRVIIDK